MLLYYLFIKFNYKIYQKEKLTQNKKIHNVSMIIYINILLYMFQIYFYELKHTAVTIILQFFSLKFYFQLKFTLEVTVNYSVNF